MATSKSIGYDNIQTETVIHTMFMEKKRSVRAELLFTDVRMCIINMLLLYLHRYTGPSDPMTSFGIPNVDFL